MSIDHKEGQSYQFDYIKSRTIFHIPSSQEDFHATLISFTDPTSLPYKLEVNEAFPLVVHTYPKVPTSPAFPLLTTAPAAVVPGQKISVDPYIVSATNIAYTKTLELLRKEIGPALDLEKIWGEHIYYVSLRSFYLSRVSDNNVVNGGIRDSKCTE